MHFVSLNTGKEWVALTSRFDVLTGRLLLGEQVQSNLLTELKHGQRLYNHFGPFE